MTNEEAIVVLQKIKPIPHRGDGKSVTHTLEIIAIDKAIKALEQQPCEYCISRQRVLDIINFEDKWLFDAKSHNADTEIAFSAIKTKISKMPPVTPKFTDAEIQKMQELEQAQLDKAYELGKTEIRPCEDCISREAVDEYITNLLSGYLYDEERTRLEDLTAYIWELSPVQPTRPTGRWIDIQYFKNDDTYYRPKCPFCSIEPKEYSNYCPNCGARMEV